ncbi:MAG: DUF3347 domain-containing protein [Bacteroidetes bacterium]|nr:DUF3347 domain-containing protein [Bacteroidota bacterium]MBU1372708.1 DUF3347 domain-containing protein [Bacteroidota bacterium]MBU1484904.1 DUF3347 domain-containing protein [Bacteroidota bacterium]MBU1761689.1 DUF3347 domain-containing protein [Bacteroidota bacterium]MBU2046401.1 DUF3347 domain-containing protein [Bacteroidota bacterium]
MRTLILSAAISTLFFVACNSNGNKQETSSTTAENTEMKTNEIAKGPVQGILAGYLEMKNALAKDDDKGAADAGKEMVKAFDGFDKSTLNAEQAKVFADIQTDAREHAEHIGSNAGNIEHQREHFETLSQEVYDLVKVTGAGEKLYYTNCPMYNNNKGANWLSETKEIHNPYLGKSMQTCGSVKEELN